MEHPIVHHLSQCLAALGLGFGLGLWYDFIRGQRRACPSLTWLFDLIFGVTFLPALWLFGLYVGGGQFELFFFPLGFLGWLAYERAVHPWLAPCFFRIFSRYYRVLKKILKKVAKIGKKFFSFWGKWGRIGYKYSLAKKHRQKRRRWPI